MTTPSHPLVIAHRGASASAPENTLAAFALAVAHDADGIELDVRRTADDVLVIHHDPSIDGFGPIVARPFAELRAETPSVPTLDEMLEVAGDLLLNLEIKNIAGQPDYDPGCAVADRVVRWVRSNGLQHRVIVTSFDPATTARVRRLDDELVTGQLTGFLDDLRAGAAAVAAAGHTWIVPPYGLLGGSPADAIALAHGHGLRIMVWTLDDPATMRIFAEARIDGVITNDPALANEALAA